MQSGTVITFRDDSKRPYSELVLGNGDRVQIALGRRGLTITQIGGSKTPKILFHAPPDTVSHICAGLVSSPQTLKVTPLQILVAAIVQLGSADDVRQAFHSAAATVP